MVAVQRVLRYLKGTPFQGLFYSANSNFQLESFCDSDWGSCLDSNGMLKSVINAMYFQKPMISCSAFLTLFTEGQGWFEPDIFVISH